MLSVILQVCSLVTSLAAAVAILAKPIREWLFGTKKIEDGQKCMLRAEMLRIYYGGKDAGDKVRQYEFENFILMYAAYKALGGNSFIDKINKEVQEMEVVT
jgi:hypothetical protein